MTLMGWHGRKTSTQYKNQRLIERQNQVAGQYGVRKKVAVDSYIIVIKKKIQYCLYQKSAKENFKMFMLRMERFYISQPVL